MYILEIFNRPIFIYICFFYKNKLMEKRKASLGKKFRNL